MRAEIIGLYQDVIGPSGPPAPELLGSHSTFVLARLDGKAIGCGAFKPLEAGVAEIKRMYVVPAFRRRGIAHLLLTYLEQLAPPQRFNLFRLETGTRQPEAIALYESHGYHRIPPYGRYIGEPLSICFEKKLSCGK